jgi:hypothetical protein
MVAEHRLRASCSVPVVPFRAVRGDHEPRGERMQSKPTPRAQRVPAGQPRKLTDVLQRKAAAAQQMRASMPMPAKRLPGHGHRVHGK